MKATRNSFIEGFWARVQKTDSCWHWTGRRTRRGDGEFEHAGRIYKAHRLAFELTHGAPPDGQLSKSCGNRDCVNPDHFVGGGWITESPTYRTVHNRLRLRRGKATAYPCVDCGQQATQWSYDHADPDELTGLASGKRLAYSASLDHYEPRCDRCHTMFDQPGFRTQKFGLRMYDTCGTHAGYQKHRRARTTPCRDCRLASNAYERDRRSRSRQGCEEDE